MKGGRLGVDGKNIFVRAPNPPCAIPLCYGNEFISVKDGDFVLVVDANKGKGSPVRQCEVDVVVPELHIEIHYFTSP
jgi:hypothetical protein